jgi:hypothetical protein
MFNLNIKQLEKPQMGHRTKLHETSGQNVGAHGWLKIGKHVWVF